MESPLLYLATTMILSCAVAAFSRGAGPASCQTMSPGHIRAQPQDPKQSHVTIRTSLRSYLPGQLVTVTVRSSRDFMGFLLQARSGVDPEAGAAAGSRAEGPVLVGGSWTLAPPGTHTLRCLSEGDTLTHSDKQLKRNLSFVWRAPDAPVGDVRFYITVVQSYFVYWAGIKSAVVRDGSRSLWTGRNTTGAQRERAVFGLRDENLTAVPGKQGFTPEGVWSSTASPMSLAGHQMGRGVTKRNNSGNQNPRSLSSDNYPDLGSVAEESRSDPYSSHLPFITPLPPDESAKTFSAPAPPFPLRSLRHWKHESRERKDPETRTSNRNLLKPSENRSLLSTSPSVQTSQKPTGPPNVPTSLFAYETPSNFATSQRRLTRHENQSQSRSLLQSWSHTDTDTSSTKTISHSIPFLPNPLNSPKSLLQPHTKPEENPSASRDGLPQAPSSSRQTQLQTFLARSRQKVSYAPRNLALSNKVVEGLSTSPQPRPQAHLQTVPAYTQPSVSTRRLDALLLTTRTEHAIVSSSTMVKSISPFYSSTSSQGVISLQSSASRKAPLDVSEDTTTQPSFTRSSSQEKKSPGFSALPNPPPKSISIILSSPFQMVSSSTSSTFLMSGVINSPPSARLFSRGPFSASSNPGTGSSLSSSTTTSSPAVPSSTKACVPSTSHPSSSIPTSVGPSSLILPAPSSSQATSPHPGPSPAPRQSDYNLPSIPPPPLPSPRQIRVASSDPKQKRKTSTSSRKLQSNIGGVLKPKSAKPDTKLPFNPSKIPSMEGKYPESVPRHSSWELGMLLGCSAGLGMALVVGVRYVYRQACGKRTEVTLNDRERDYGRGERRMIQVQECGDLVRVRRIRENSLVLLAEYDILASPGD
ncbi:reelin domain-containing protein 1 isoform X2 [Phyllopteryx taeniolatus]|nr:reelin domain-containing protein 1 isoform X2 [Phyllopteryx taeniolatus]XP_061619915.1 reelin domain-containing protein 1 isoform X2 [Phyllopteryx taeniolatus]